jgi:hypothetical protein
MSSSCRCAGAVGRPIALFAASFSIWLAIGLAICFECPGSSTLHVIIAFAFLMQLLHRGVIPRETNSGTGRGGDVGREARSTLSW